MQAFWFAIAAAGLSLGGCADSPLIEGSDVPDPEAKEDAATRPLGVYSLDDPASYQEVSSYLLLDLRANDTFAMHRQNDSGDVIASFGIYWFTRDRWDNRYIRFRDDTEPEDDWRERYRSSGDELDFFYRGLTSGWTMDRLPGPADEVLAALRAAYQGGAPLRALEDPAITGPIEGMPTILPARAQRLQEDAWRRLEAFTLTIDGEKYFILEVRDEGGGDADVEIYATTSQLVAVGSGPDRASIMWDESR